MPGAFHIPDALRTVAAAIGLMSPVIAYLLVKRVLKFLTGVPALYQDELVEALLKSHVMGRWKSLEPPPPASAAVAVYGAGKHTAWLETVIGSFPPVRVRVVAVLDDNPRPTGPHPWGMASVKPQDLDVSGVDAIVLSSDTEAKEAMRRQAKRRWGDKIPVVDLYEGLPPGPYPKGHF